MLHLKTKRVRQIEEQIRTNNRSNSLVYTQKLWTGFLKVQQYDELYVYNTRT